MFPCYLHLLCDCCSTNRSGLPRAFAGSCVSLSLPLRPSSSKSIEAYEEASLVFEDPSNETSLEAAEGLLYALRLLHLVFLCNVCCAPSHSCLWTRQLTWRNPDGRLDSLQVLYSSTSWACYFATCFVLSGCRRAMFLQAVAHRRIFYC